MVYVPMSTTLTGSIRQTVSMPFLEGAAGVVAGFALADYVSSAVISSTKTTSTSGMGLLLKGITKFVLGGLALFTASNLGNAFRVITTGVALGSVSSFLVDVISFVVPKFKVFQIGIPFKHPLTSGPTVVAGQPVVSTPLFESQTRKVGIGVP